MARAARTEVTRRFDTGSTPLSDAAARGSGGRLPDGAGRSGTPPTEAVRPRWGVGSTAKRIGMYQSRVQTNFVAFSVA
ncbi:hypothetical protein GCM10010358_32460 [Streptomyces minutiscleroticus]|uniref:Uncharacterized protein n=1 Tax=Streptomyces minutiscleroticus TaxID=68238 RepID=A0A918KSR1_9ACTN|nr:hypothetical protein GCM10010358_32460 [Streptomyces minutiscleroticus]